jgi:RHS repeat-associated protein
MTSAQTAEFQVVLIAAYGYDPFNRRIVRVVPGEGLDVRYSYDGWREVEELAPVSVEGAMVARARKVMVWGAEFSEILSYHRWEDQGTGQWDWSSYMVSQDEQGSVTWLHRADGSEVEAVEYDPYGKRTVFPAAGGSQARSTVGFDVSYTGHRIDHETGLIYARNRYLHTGWGRFVTLDPLGAWADGGNSGNGYGYVGNVPTGATDPLGLLSVLKDGVSDGLSLDASGGLDLRPDTGTDSSGLIYNNAGGEGAGGQGADGGGSSPGPRRNGCCERSAGRLELAIWYVLMHMVGRISLIGPAIGNRPQGGWTGADVAGAVAASEWPQDVWEASADSSNEAGGSDELGGAIVSSPSGNLFAISSYFEEARTPLVVDKLTGLPNPIRGTGYAPLGPALNLAMALSRSTDCELISTWHTHPNSRGPSTSDRVFFSRLARGGESERWIETLAPLPNGTPVSVPSIIIGKGTDGDVDLSYWSPGGKWQTFQK